MNSCSLCHPENETVLWRDESCRVIFVDDADYPGFCRVIWGGHVKEMTDLTEPERAHLMAVVFATEGILRETLQPAKINLASLGNQAPHLHWHVIPRFIDDAHFPDPVWAARKRTARAASMDRLRLIGEFKQRLSSSLD
jgi:diadenosine tetraphosphate (Ap4A) HIT family hydrolase